MSQPAVTISSTPVTRMAEPASLPPAEIHPTYSWQSTPIPKVVAFGSPSDARLGGRIAVLKYGDVLKRLSDC
jgi:hypothetical protein